MRTRVVLVSLFVIKNFKNHCGVDKNYGVAVAVVIYKCNFFRLCVRIFHLTVSRVVKNRA